MSEDDKKRDRALQRRVRERQAKTGESYQAAWRQLTGSEAPTEEAPAEEPPADEPIEVAVDADSIAALQTKWSQRIGGVPPAGTPPKTVKVKTSFNSMHFAERLILALHLPRVLPRQPTRVATRAKKGAIDIGRIFISAAGTEGGTGDWIVNDIEVDGRSQLTLKNLSGSLFGSRGIAANPKATTTFSIEGFDPVEYDCVFAIIVTYIGTNPEGAPFFASAVGVSPPQRPTIVPFVSEGSLPILTKTTISMRIENAPFQLERLEISNEGTACGSADWIVNDLRINGRTQFVQSGDIPGDMFAISAIDSFVALEECEAGNEIEIDVTYVGVAERAIFKGRLEGTVVRDDHSTPPPDLRVIVRTGDKIPGEALVATCNWRPRPPTISPPTISRDAS